MQLRKERAYFMYRYLGNSPILRESRAGLKAGSEAETIEECCYWLNSSGLLSYLPYPTLDHLSSGGTAHSVLGLQHQSVIKKTPTDMPTVQSDADNPLVEVPSSRMTQVCVKLIKN